MHLGELISCTWPPTVTKVDSILNFWSNLKRERERYVSIGGRFRAARSKGRCGDPGRGGGGAGERVSGCERDACVCPGDDAEEKQARVGRGRRRLRRGPVTPRRRSPAPVAVQATMLKKRGKVRRRNTEPALARPPPPPPRPPAAPPDS
ncbi:hypothetical protein ACJJTC_012613 [Scirpophaga incertulas]